MEGDERDIATFDSFFPVGYSAGTLQARPYEQSPPRKLAARDSRDQTFPWLGSMKYPPGAVAYMLLAEKIKTPEWCYLILAGMGAGL